MCMSSYCVSVEEDESGRLWSVYDLFVSSCWCGNEFAVRHIRSEWALGRKHNRDRLGNFQKKGLLLFSIFAVFSLVFY